MQQIVQTYMEIQQAKTNLYYYSLTFSIDVTKTMGINVNMHYPDRVRVVSCVIHSSLELGVFYELE